MRLQAHDTDTDLDLRRLDLFVLDPTRPVQGPHIEPIEVWVVMVVLNNTWDQIHNEIESYRTAARFARRPDILSHAELKQIPLNMAAYDEAIESIAVCTPTEYRRLCTQQHVQPAYDVITRNCALCGGGLGVETCNGCHAEFVASPDHLGWDVPLPLRVIRSLEKQGHHFALDPRRLVPKKYPTLPSWQAHGR